MSRAVWFVAGVGAGAYAVVRARRAAEVLTPEGLRDRWSGLAVGAQLFAEEVRAGRHERESELRERLGLTLHGPRELARAPGAGNAPGADRRTSPHDPAREDDH